MKKKLLISTIFISLLGCLSVFGQDPAVRVERVPISPLIWETTNSSKKSYDLPLKYGFVNIDIEEGLSNSYINAAIEDPIGRMWIASYGGGINVWDGVEMQYISESDGLSNNNVFTFLKDGDSCLWMGTLNGITKFNGEQFDTYTSLRGESVGRVNSMAMDSSYHIWFTSTIGGIYKIANDSVTKFDSSNGFTNEVFNCVYSLDDNLYFLTSDGNMYILEDEKLELILHSKEDYLYSMFESDGQVFISGYDTIYTFQDSRLYPFVAARTVSSMVMVGDNYWFSSDKGIVVTDKKGNLLDLINMENGLKEADVSHIYKDSKNNVWISTYGGGVSRYSNPIFSHYESKKLGFDRVFALQYNQQDSTMRFFSQELGFLDIKGGEASQILLEDEISVGNLWSIGLDSLGRYWYGTSYGIMMSDGNQYNSMSYIGEKLIGRVFDCNTENGRILFSSSRFGLLEIIGDTIYRYNYDFSNIRRIEYDQFDNIWLASHMKGIYKIDSKNGTVVNYNKDHGLPSNYNFDLAFDKNDNLWVATDANGICKISQDENNSEISLQSFTTENGLTNNVIYDVFIDKEGEIWLGTDRGLDKVLEINDDSIIVHNYGLPEGFTGNDVNVGAVSEDSDGQTWWGTGRKLTVYHSDKDKVDTFSIDLIIKHIQINYKDYKEFSRNSGLNHKLKKWSRIPEELTLNYNQNHISFEFVALNYKYASKMKYQFYLEGSEDTFNEPNDQNFATYSNLAPGNYTLKVLAVDPYGAQSDMAEYKFKILPPIWGTTWFRVIAIITFFGLLYLVYRWRTYSLTQKKIELEKLVQERTSDLNEANEELNQTNEELAAQRDQIEEQKNIIEHAHRDVISSIKYAKRIQDALLKSEEHESEHLPPHFILFQPKDIVSGDFYWALEKESHLYIAAVDCTGHGVPGAFLTMLGAGFLNEINSSKELLSPATILDQLRDKIIKELASDGSTKDGMDISLLKLDLRSKNAEWAGANNPLYLLRKEEIQIIKGDREPIGHTENPSPFTNHSLELIEGDTIFLFTDGYADQFGGSKGKKLGYKNFRKKLISISNEDMNKQKELLTAYFKEWKGNEAQVDDVCVMGVRV